MAKHTKKRVVQLLQHRVEVIECIGRLLPDTYPIGVVEWFGLEMKGALNGLSYEPIEQPTSGGSARVDIKGRTHERDASLLVSDLLLAMFVNLANECHLDDDELSTTIDNYVIHEIVHRCQGMGEQAHRRLSLLAPNVLHENDYEADASAVLIQFVLKLMELQGKQELGDAVFLLWRTYAKLIKSTIFQMHLFTLYNEEQKKLRNNEESKSEIVSFLRWERMCIWHFQYHRALSFNSTLSLGDFQIMFKPAIALRNQYIASEVHLDAFWPSKEWDVVPHDRLKETRDLDMFCFSSINRWGIRQHATWNPRASDQVHSLFVGIFTADTNLSESFFRPLLNEKRFLVGDTTLEPSGTPPNGGSPANFKNAIAQASKGSAQEMAMAVATILKPTRHPGVVAESYSKALKLSIESLSAYRKTDQDELGGTA